MRLWSVHPAQLDRVGLVACWREALLAQAVLAGRTKGYTNHPQLDRFKVCDDPMCAIGAYLDGLLHEALARGFHFDGSRIQRTDHGPIQLAVTEGQLAYEWGHLGAKLAARSPEDSRRWLESAPQPHPMFLVVPGGVEEWERAS